MKGTDEAAQVVEPALETADGDLELDQAGLLLLLRAGAANREGEGQGADDEAGCGHGAPPCPDVRRRQGFVSA